MLYNETLNIISSSDNKTPNSCIVYIVLFSVCSNFYNDLMNIKIFNINNLKRDKKGVSGIMFIILDI